MTTLTQTNLAHMARIVGAMRADPVAENVHAGCRSLRWFLLQLEGEAKSRMRIDEMVNDGAGDGQEGAA